MSDFASWIGREDRSDDLLGAPFARRWLATFDLAQAETPELPQGVHWCLCLPETPTARLGPDGHPLRDGAPGSFLPPIAQPRRMWAGSTCEFLAPLAIGAEVERVSRIEQIVEKQGNSGPLTFATILHETRAHGALAVRERQTLVYREAPPAGAPAAPPPTGDARFDEDSWDAVRHITPSPQLLFRYSALTFNTHRIHYDADYVREVEAYRGRVVHGPLMASLLLQLAARQFGENRLARFEFRGMSPAIAGEELVLVLRGAPDAIQLGAFAAGGRQVMRASAACQA
jgi:3-methylfumaryl-CoA hydratase